MCALTCVVVPLASTKCSDMKMLNEERGRLGFPRLVNSWITEERRRLLLELLWAQLGLVALELHLEPLPVPHRGFLKGLHGEPLEERRLKDRASQLTLAVTRLDGAMSAERSVKDGNSFISLHLLQDAKTKQKELSFTKMRGFNIWHSPSHNSTVRCAPCWPPAGGVGPPGV
ncbi:hypothetical protein EYF80_042772 [Liparis tanakae]|uniref:Uncharacterized protein n=1 Tax=Liparis tanakae TaxID=230148 RepID=A0A4Z2G0J1_9TELE|nr:hypothetical protein EYF80_042772 [Liparis tanakae]